MRKLLFILIVIFILPLYSLAHGGVSKNTDKAIVFLNQSPLSPLVGEKVIFTFALTDKDYQPLKNLEVGLTLIDTFYGDESKDKKILSQNFTTDNNGNFTFEYTFEKQNYFDVDLSFQDPQTHLPQDTGFLVQPRIAKTEPGSIKFFPLFIVAIIGLIIGLGLKKLSSKNLKQSPG